ncbi:MAG: ribosome maturation factor RimP [Defluviitaleaceae bacterium]|nr:ribosome maturation factor RimP [Defluviitaleaceae bacterium]
MDKTPGKQSLETLLAPVVEANGCELYDLEFVKEGGDRILRLYIDKPEGVDLNDCEAVSRAAEVVLDEADPIAGAYRLQVGSPGVERSLHKPQHFTRYVGHKVAVRLFAPYSPPSGTSETVTSTGRKKFTGILKAYDGDKIKLKDEDGTNWTFELSQVSACRLVVF